MKISLISMNYMETYYYANIVQNVLRDQFSYLRNIHDWHEDREAALFLRPFSKFSVLHDFSAFIIERLIDEKTQDTDVEVFASEPKEELWIDLALKFHDIETPGFRVWLSENSVLINDLTDDHLYEYMQDLWLTGEMDSLLDRLTNEVFFVLFGNRGLLILLNDYVACSVQRMVVGELESEDADLLEKDGVLKRKRLPEWVKRAVFFRDRGRCVLCNKDLSALLAIGNFENFDHIVPLANGGINDVTNIQLACEDCNNRKSSGQAVTSNKYEAWYEADD